MSAPRELADLLASVALGDRAAFERLYRATAPQLFGLVLRITKDPDAAADVLQEGFVRIWNHAADFRPDKATPMTWMGAIVRNQAIDTIRRSARQPLATEPVEDLYWLAEDNPGPGQTADRDMDAAAVRACLDRLEGAQRKAMILAYFHGMTHEELARHMDAPLGTVKSWLRRGLMRLKGCLDER